MFVLKEQLIMQSQIMQKLTNKEEEIMHILWRLEKAFVKDVLQKLKDENLTTIRFLQL